MLKPLADLLHRLWRNESGATAIEYSLIASAVFLGIAPLIALMRTDMDSIYDKILNYFVLVGVG